MAAFAPHHQADLGVGLQRDEAIDHLHAGPFQIARPFDVGGLVEARLELDQRGDRLARLRRLDQGADDGAVLAGAIKRLLDRHHIGIGRGLAQELHHRVEAFEGMMDDQVLFADGGEAIAAMIADALGEAGDVGLELQIGALRDDELGQVRQAHQMFDDHDLGFVQIQMRGDELAQMRRHRLACISCG